MTSPTLKDADHEAEEKGARQQAVTNSSLEARAVVAKLFRALGHPARLALLELLSTGEHTGTECVRHVGLSQGRVATHLACLTDCGFIVARRRGAFMRYRIADSRVLEIVRLGRGLAADNAANLAACTRIDAFSTARAAGDRPPPGDPSPAAPTRGEASAEVSAHNRRVPERRQ